MGRKPKNINITFGDDDSDEYLDVSGWADEKILDGKVEQEFNFCDDAILKKEREKNDKENIKFTSDVLIQENEIEFYDVRKTVHMKRSTAKMITELRLMHPNVNVRMNKIVDDAVRYYYKIIKENGGFSE